MTTDKCGCDGPPAAKVEGVCIADDAFARLVGSAGEHVLLFEVAQDFVEEEWSEPVLYRFVRTDGGLLSLEFRRV